MCTIHRPVDAKFSWTHWSPKYGTWPKYIWLCFSTLLLNIVTVSAVLLSLHGRWQVMWGDAHVCMWVKVLNQMMTYVDIRYKTGFIQVNAELLSDSLAFVVFSFHSAAHVVVVVVMSSVTFVMRSSEVVVAVPECPSCCWQPSFKQTCGADRETDWW